MAKTKAQQYLNKQFSTVMELDGQSADMDDEIDY